MYNNVYVYTVKATLFLSSELSLVSRPFASAFTLGRGGEKVWRSRHNFTSRRNVINPYVT